MMLFGQFMFFFDERILIYELYFMSGSQLYFWAVWTAQGAACHSLGLQFGV